MPPAIVHLPNGHTLTVTPVFGGVQFKPNDWNTHHNVFPPGWTVVLSSEDDDDDDDDDDHGRIPVNIHNNSNNKTHSNNYSSANVNVQVHVDDEHAVKPSAAAHTLPNPDAVPAPPAPAPTPPPPASSPKHHMHRFRRPSLHNDHLFISSISNPASTEFRPASSPTRQIAMMLWVTLWWYFHQPAPPPYLKTPSSPSSSSTRLAMPEEGQPKGEWRVNINREGIFNRKHLLPKLERMGLIASDDSSVGIDPGDGVTKAGEGWSHMFVSQRMFWQLDPRIYLFTLSPNLVNPAATYPSSASPVSSRSTSPTRTSASPNRKSLNLSETASVQSASAVHAANRANTPPGPFTSGSHLPTFYPPHPLQYTFSHGIRHPIRPKPPRQGETFYTRFVPSLGQRLSFRVACLGNRPVIYRGTTSCMAPDAVLGPATRDSLRTGAAPGGSEPTTPPPSMVSSLTLQQQPPTPLPPPLPLPPDPIETTGLTDTELLHRWMNDPRVAQTWGEDGPIEHQEAYLKRCLTSRHSFPVIGCFDGRPFGYFEIYWVKEDALAAHLGCDAGDWDRGLHVLVGEQDFRGPHRVHVWLSALVHYCWLADLRTNVVMTEPRVDNLKIRKYCEQVGFYKEREITFPHKQSNLMKIRREAWSAPSL